MTHTQHPIFNQLLALFFLSAVTACALPPLLPNAMETIRVELSARSALDDCLYPEKPAVRKVEWFDHEGSRQTLITSQPTAEIQIRAGSFTPVLVHTVVPINTLPENLVPAAGSLYPLDAKIKNNQTILQPRQNTGLSARLARTVITSATAGPKEGRLIAAAFNWRRLEREAFMIQDRIWIDELRMSTAILSGRFSVREIRVPQVYTIELVFDTDVYGTLPAVLYSVYGEQITLTGDGAKRTISYRSTDGLHRLFFPQGWLTLIQTNGTPSLHYFTIRHL